MSNCVERQPGDLAKLVLDLIGVITPGLVEGGKEGGKFEPVVDGGPLDTGFLRGGDDGIAGGEQGNRFELIRGKRRFQRI